MRGSWRTHAGPGRTYTAHKEMSRHALASVWPLLLIYHVQSLPCYFTITLFGDFPHDPSKTNSSQSLREPKQMWTWSNWTNVSLVTSGYTFHKSGHHWSTFNCNHIVYMSCWPLSDWHVGEYLKGTECITMWGEQFVNEQQQSWEWTQVAARYNRVAG